MNKLLTILSLGAVMASFNAAANVEAKLVQENLEQEAVAKIKAFRTQLKSTLKGAGHSGGLTKGIKVCNASAPGIADANSNNGWQLGRTSLKLRNPANKPDAWELTQLNKFEQALASGTAAKTLKTSEVVIDENGEKHFRFMKAIPTGQLCLNCHGQQLTPEVKQALNTLYPNDKATGFALGQIRGAFTLSKKL